MSLKLIDNVNPLVCFVRETDDLVFTLRNLLNHINLLLSISFRVEWVFHPSVHLQHSANVDFELCNGQSLDPLYIASIWCFLFFLSIYFYLVIPREGFKALSHC